MQALLIEDNRVFQIKLRNILNSLGYEVTTASSVKESVVCLKIEKFDLLICDIVLSDGEFFDIDTVPVVPTIFITAYENPTYMEKALKANNAVFIVKPFSDLTFVAAVKNITVKVVISDDLIKAVISNDLITVFGKYKNPITIAISEVEAIESEGNYSAIFTINNGKYIVKRSAKKIIEKIISPDFVRVQRSTYINRSKVIRVLFAENKIFTLNQEFPVSKVYRKNIYEFHSIVN